MTSLWRVAVRTPRERAEERARRVRRARAAGLRGAGRRGRRRARRLRRAGDTLETVRARFPERDRRTGRGRLGGRAGARSTGRSRWPESGSARRGRRPPIRRAPWSSTRVARSAPARTRRHGSASSCSPSSGAAGRCSTSAAARASSGSPPRASASARSPASTSIRSRSRRPLANAAANGVEVVARVVDALSEPLPAADVAVANVLLRPVGGDPRPTRRGRLRSRPATSRASGPHTPGGGTGRRLVLDGWAADRFERGATATA